MTFPRGPMKTQSSLLFAVRLGSSSLRTSGETGTLAAQVESTLVARGLTLIIEGTSSVTSWIYISRREIPGFIPWTLQAKLQSEGWAISNDVYGEEFACVWRRFSGNDVQALAEAICVGLELLGAPQKSSWHLAHRAVSS